MQHSKTRSRFLKSVGYPDGGVSDLEFWDGFVWFEEKEPNRDKTTAPFLLGVGKG